MSFVLKTIIKKVVDQAVKEGLPPQAVSHLGIGEFFKMSPSMLQPILFLSSMRSSISTWSPDFPYMWDNK